MLPKWNSIYVFNIFHCLPLILCVILENAQKSDFTENEWLRCGVCAFKPLKCCCAYTKVWKKEKERASTVQPIPISYSFVVSVHDDASKEGSLHRVNRIKMKKTRRRWQQQTMTRFSLIFLLLSVSRLARDRLAFVLFFLLSLHWGTVSISTAKVRCTECRTLEYNWKHNLLNQSTNISMPLDQLYERASLKRLFMVIIIHAMMWFVNIVMHQCNLLDFTLNHLNESANQTNEQNKTIANVTN